MAENRLESNVILRTRIPKATGPGFKGVHSDLDKLEKRLVDITSKTWTIKVKVDDRQAKRLGISFAGGGPGGSPASGGPALGPATRRLTERATKVSVGKEGDITETRKAIEESAKGMERFKETTIEVDGATKSMTTAAVNAYEKQRVKIVGMTAAERARLQVLRETEQQIRSNLAAGRAKFEGVSATGRAVFRDEERRTLALLTKEQADAAQQQVENAQKVQKAQEALEKDQRRVKRAAARDYGRADKFFTGVDAEKAKKEADAQAAAQADADRLRDAREKRRQTYLNKRRREDQAELKSNAEKIAKDRKSVADQAAKDAAAAAKLQVSQNQMVEDQQAKGHKAREIRFKSEKAVRQRLSQLQDEGFKITGEGQKWSQSKGAFEDTIKMQHVAGNALQGYTVRQVEASVAGQRLTQTTLTGAAAWRAVGDSMVNAAVKVSTWLAATTLVFAAIRGFQALTAEILALQEGSVLLARVGRNLGSDFASRSEAAQRLTKDFQDLSASIGGTASEAQQAAAIFARAGYSEIEVLQGVKAAMLAAQIAELGVVESAELLAAATFQFNLDAKDILPTLNQLNSLSNNYRTTTDDLLQAVSRTGAVFAQQGGRLSELGAITAVTSEKTARSGAEIGNAMKTIISNLDRVETRQVVLQKLGVNLNTVEGASKSYTQVLLELDLASQRLSDTEKNQLTTFIAGVRQRNILLTQMKSAVEIVSAEIKLLLEEKGSPDAADALTEFGQRATTLGAALERLRGEALKAGAQVGGPFAEVAEQAANSLALILKWLSVFEGAPAKLAGWVTIIAAVTMGLQYLGTTYGITTAAVYNKIAAMVTYTVTSVKQGTAIAGVTAALRAQAAAYLLAMAPMIEVVAVALVLVGILYLLGRAINSNAEATALATAAEKGAASAAEEAATAAANKAQAYLNVSNALTTYILRLEELKRIEASTGKSKKIDDEREKIKKGIVEISGAAVIRGGTPKQIQEEALKRANAQRKIQAQEMEKMALAEMKTGAFAEVQKGRAEERLRIAKANEAGTATLAETDSVIDRMTDAMGLTSHIQVEIAAAEAEINKYRKESVESQEKLNALQKELVVLHKQLESQLGKERKFAEAYTNLGMLGAQQERERELKPVRDAAREAMGGERYTDTTNQLNKSLQETEAHYRDLDILINDFKTPHKDLEVQLDKYNKSLQETEALWKKAMAAASSSIQEEVGARRGRAMHLTEEAFVIAGQRARGLSGTTSEMLDPLAENRLRREAIAQNLKESQGRGAYFAAGAKNPAESATQRFIFAQDAQAENLEAQKQLARLTELEGEHAILLLRTEEQIAVARKKSADEAARALGTLSDEDKLRVLSQAQYFAKNPGAKISLGQQFLGDSASMGLGRQFFGSKFAGMEPGSDPLSAMLAGGGFGITEELGKAGDEYARARGTLTDQQILQRAQARANAASDARNRMAGNAAGAVAGMLPGAVPYELGGAGAAAMNMNVEVGNVDFTPLLHTFEHVLVEVMDQKVLEAAEVWREIFAKRERTQPKFGSVAGPTE